MLQYLIDWPISLIRAVSSTTFNTQGLFFIIKSLVNEKEILTLFFIIFSLPFYHFNFYRILIFPFLDKKKEKKKTKEEEKVPFPIFNGITIFGERAYNKRELAFRNTYFIRDNGISFVFLLLLH